MRRIAILGVSVVAALAAALPAPAQVPGDGGAATSDWTVPLTPWGHPDFEGVWTSDEEFGIPLERPEALGTRTTLTDEALAVRARTAEQRARLEFADRSALTAEEKADLPPDLLSHSPVGDGPEHWFELGKAVSPRSSLIVAPENGRIPPFTPGARLRVIDPSTIAGFETGVGSKGSGPFNGPEDFDLAERCITRGLPNTWFPQVYNNGFQIVQHPDHVAILYERLHEHRIIPLDGRPHLRSEVRQIMGDSRGRWEGDTLVVEVTNFGPTTYKGSSAGLHLVERYRRVDADTITVDITLEDPTTWTAPWTARITGKRDPRYWQIFEYACHEANYSLSNMLSGARAEEGKKGRGPE